MEANVETAMEFDRFKKEFTEKIMVLKYKGAELDKWK